MTEDSGKSAYRAEKVTQLRARSKLLADTRVAILALLQTAADTLAARLATATSEYVAANLTALQREVAVAIQTFQTGAAAQIGSAAGTAWSAGQSLVDAPLSAGGVSLIGVAPAIDTRQLNALRAFMTDRIKDVGVQAVNQINTELGLAAIGAQPVTESISAVQAILGAAGAKPGFGQSARDRAITIVRTELSRVYAVAAQERLAQASEVVTGLKKQWRRSGKLHSRLSHDLADGQIVAADQPFVIQSLRGPVLMMYPHDPKAPAAEVINCGCTALPYRDGWDVATPGKKRFTEREMAANPRKAEIQQALDEGMSVADALAGGRAA